jgi:ABC-type branched-subunit amino acid transport system ATPase component
VPLLEVRDLHKSFGGVVALDGVCFEVEAGSVSALIGPNGAGKSTCFNVIGGQLGADSGSVALAGQVLSGHDARAVCRMGVARTFQIAATFASLSARENLEVALLAHEQDVYRLWGRPSSACRSQAMSLLADVGLAHAAGSAAATLAYGDQKRLELALALASRPKLLLMDEPTAGMAPGERHAVMEMTRALVTARGMGVLFTEHSMDVVFGHADRVIVLAGGRIVAQGEPHAVRANQAAQAVYFGGALSTSLAPP